VENRSHVMDCKEIVELLPAQVDAELGPREVLRVDQHLQGCAACRAEYVQLAAARAAVKKHATYFAAPGDLARRIEVALPSPAAPRNRRIWPKPYAGALLATMVALTWSLGLYMTLPTATDRLRDEVVANHVRSLMSDHATDVASSDQHTVKPWFNGKLDFSPPVNDLTTEGFPLVGGRLDYLAHRPVAALVYRHNQHVINLFVAPASAARDLDPQHLARQGYHLIHWVRGGLDFWAVSDVDPVQLEKFKNLVMARTGPV
jgi:anti-sigma factor RsiW